ncbi:hypothetical protein [Polyangium sp. 15x6]|uniref:hypothetical protein n=1 Tax=Polyangium sp. 15x6 TaxID=3042687 RepID=UPI002499B3FE|nr:hypothetical protein [Polyangium sp. 15x6]MDI3287792.1 hypothetical protein [Polyangium sp. 15x6]
MSTNHSQDKSIQAPNVEFTIPSKDLGTLCKILQLDDSVREDLWRAIEDAPIGVSGNDLEARILDATPLTPADAKDIVTVLARMYLTKVHTADVSASDFVDAVMHAITRDHTIEFTGESRDILQRVLSFDRTIGISAKAKEMVGEYERILQDVRILTDIRPIFDGSADAVLSATVVVHNLRLRYVDSDGASRDFIVSLDGDDLRSIAKSIERASKKEAEIRAFMAKSGMPCIALTSSQS